MREPARSPIAQAAAPGPAQLLTEEWVVSGSSRDRRSRDLSLCQLPPGVRAPALPGATGTPDPVPPGATGTPDPVHLPAPRGTPDSVPPGATGYPKGQSRTAHTAWSLPPGPMTLAGGTGSSFHSVLRTREPRLQPVPPGRATRLPVVLLGHPSTYTLQDAHRPEPPVPPGCPTQIPPVPPDTPDLSPSGAARDDRSCSPRCHRDTRPRAPPGARSPPPLPAGPPAPGAPRIPVPPVPGCRRGGAPGPAPATAAPRAPPGSGPATTFS